MKLSLAFTFCLFPSFARSLVLLLKKKLGKGGQRLQAEVAPSGLNGCRPEGSRGTGKGKKSRQGKGQKEGDGKGIKRVLGRLEVG